MDQIDEIIATTMVNNFCIIIPKNGLDGKYNTKTEYRRQYHNLIDSYVNAFCMGKQKYETVNRARYIVIDTFLKTYNHYFPESPMTMINFINKIAEPLFTARRFQITKFDYKKKFFDKFMNKIMRKFHNWAIDNSVELTNLRFYETKTREINEKLKNLLLKWKSAFLNYIKTERDSIYKEISFIVDQRQPFTAVTTTKSTGIINKLIDKYKKAVILYKELKKENEELKNKIIELNDRNFKFNESYNEFNNELNNKSNNKFNNESNNEFNNELNNKSNNKFNNESNNESNNELNNESNNKLNNINDTVNINADEESFDEDF